LFAESLGSEGAGVDFLSWLDAHTVGWQLLVPALAGFGVAATYLARTGREPAIPWLSLCTWLAIFGGVYLLSGVHHLFGYARSRWTAIIILGAVHTATPMGIALLALFVTPRRRLRWQAHAAVVAASGLAGIPLGAVIHEWLGPYVYAWLQAG
jgi:hypothetical protein